MVEDVEKIRSRLKSKPLPEFSEPVSVNRKEQEQWPFYRWSGGNLLSLCLKARFKQAEQNGWLSLSETMERERGVRTPF